MKYVQVFGECGVSLLHTTLSRDPRTIVAETCAAVGFEHPEHFLLKRLAGKGCESLIFPAEEVEVDVVYLFNYNKNGQPLLQATRLGSREIPFEDVWVYWKEHQIHFQFPFESVDLLEQFIKTHLLPKKEDPFMLYMNIVLHAANAPLPLFSFVVIETWDGMWDRYVVFGGAETCYSLLEAVPHVMVENYLPVRVTNQMYHCSVFKRRYGAALPQSINSK